LATNRMGGVLKRCSFPVLMVLVLAVFMYVPACADGVAEGDFRPATLEERDFYQLVWSTFAEAVPVGPNGWDPTAQPKFKSLEWMPWLEPPDPFWVEYYAVWEDKERKKEANEEIAQRVLELGTVDIESVMSPDMEGFLAEFESELTAALAANDFEKVQRLCDRMAELEQQSESDPQGGAAAARRMKEEEREIRREFSPRDWKVAVLVTANSFFKGFHQPVTEERIAGRLVYRREGDYLDDGTWEDGCSYVFLGADWGLTAGDVMERHMIATAQDGLPHTAVQTITVEVWADAQRARTILEAIDWNALEGLLKQ
jgi:hypothetical protein